MTRFLINKTSALGDIAQSLAVAQYLRARDPSCQIDWIVESSGAELVLRHPDVDRVIEISSKKWRRHWTKRETRREFVRVLGDLRLHRYAAIFDLQGNAKSGLINLLARAEVRVGFSRRSLRESCNALTTSRRFDCACRSVPSRYLELVQRYFGDSAQFAPKPVFLELEESERLRVQSLVEESSVTARANRRFLICPFSAWPSKHLALTDVKEMIEQMSERLQEPIWLASGSASEQLAARQVAEQLGDKCRLLPRLSLAQLQYFMRLCKGVIATDSLPLHLAGCAKVPTLGFFGPSHPLGYAPANADQCRGDSTSTYYFGKCPYRVAFEARCPQMRRCIGPCLKPLGIGARELVANFVERASARSGGQKSWP